MGFRCYSSGINENFLTDRSDLWNSLNLLCSTSCFKSFSLRKASAEWTSLRLMCRDAAVQEVIQQAGRPAVKQAPSRGTCQPSESTSGSNLRPTTRRAVSSSQCGLQLSLKPKSPPGWCAEPPPRCTDVSSALMSVFSHSSLHASRCLDMWPTWLVLNSVWSQTDSF